MTITDYVPSGFVPLRDLGLSKDETLCLNWKLRTYLEDLNPGCRVEIKDGCILNIYSFAKGDKKLDKYNVIGYSIGKYFDKPALLRHNGKKDLICLESPDDKFLPSQFHTNEKFTDIVIENEYCPFCNIADNEEIIAETPNALALFDKYPASLGHALIIPKRHVASYRDLTNHEKEAMNVVLEYVMKKIDERFHPDGYNVGINIGEAAGQSVFHCHMHIIPRYKGDTDGPNKGILNVIPK